jgi:hypothetical protein
LDEALHAAPGETRHAEPVADDVIDAEFNAAEQK